MNLQERKEALWAVENAMVDTQVKVDEAGCKEYREMHENDLKGLRHAQILILWAINQKEEEEKLLQL